MAQVRKLQSGGDVKSKYGKFFYDGIEHEVTEELLNSLKTYNKFGEYAAKTLESGKNVSLDYRSDNDGYATGVDVPDLTDREKKQLGRTKNFATKRNVSDLKSDIRNLRNFTIPKQTQIKEEPKEKRIFDADNIIKLDYSKADKNGNRTLLNSANNQMFMDRIALYEGDFSGYDEYKFSNNEWEGKYDRANAYINSIRNILPGLKERIKSGKLTEDDIAIINSLGATIEFETPKKDVPSSNVEGVTDIKTGIIDSNNGNPEVEKDKSEVNSNVGLNNGRHIIIDNPIVDYNGRYIEDVLDKNGKSTGFVKYVHKDNPNDIILRMPGLDQFRHFSGNNIKIPEVVSQIANKYPFFWQDLASNSELQNHFIGSLYQLVNSGFNEMIMGEGAGTDFSNWLWTGTDRLSSNDLKRIGFSTEDADRIIEDLKFWGDRKNYDDGKRDIFSRRNRWIVRPYNIPSEYVESKKKGGLIDKHQDGNSFRGRQDKTNINIDQDMILGITDFLVSRGAIKKSSDLQAEAIKEAALGAMKSAPSEVYSRFSDAGLNQMYNDRIDRIRGAKTINTDARINMAENLMRESQADAMIAERDSKMSNLISQFNDRNLQEKRSYEEIRRNISDANRNTLGAMNSNFDLNKLYENNQLAQNAKSFIYQLRQNHAMNLQDRLSLDEKLASHNASVDIYNQTAKLKSQAKPIWDNLSDKEKENNPFDTWFANTYSVDIANIKGKVNYDMIKKISNNPLRKRWGIFYNDLNPDYSLYKKYKKGGKTKSHLNVDEHHFLEQMSDIRKEISEINKEILSILKRILK